MGLCDLSNSQQSVSKPCSGALAHNPCQAVWQQQWWWIECLESVAGQIFLRNDGAHFSTLHNEQ